MGVTDDDDDDDGKCLKFFKCIISVLARFAPLLVLILGFKTDNAQCWKEAGKISFQDDWVI